MKRMLTMVVAAAVLAVGASAASASYCSDKARNAANQRAAGSTAVGAIVGLGIGAAVKGKKGLLPGGVIGGVAGFAVGSAQWQQVYDAVYRNCIGASARATAPVIVVAPAPVVAGAPPSGQAIVYLSLNVRTGPGTEYAIIGVIPPNGTVAVTGCTYSWCSVLLAGGSGWAYRSYLNFY